MRMQIFLLTVGGAFLVLCIQFFRGKWLRLLAGKHVLIFGLALILLAFTDSRTDMLSLILFSVGTIYNFDLLLLAQELIKKSIRNSLKFRTLFFYPSFAINSSNLVMISTGNSSCGCILV